MTAFLLFRIVCLLPAGRAFCFGRFLPSPFSTPRGPSGPGVFLYILHKKKKKKKNFILLMIFLFFLDIN